MIAFLPPTSLAAIAITLISVTAIPGAIGATAPSRKTASKLRAFGPASAGTGKSKRNIGTGGN